MHVSIRRSNYNTIVEFLNTKFIPVELPFTYTQVMSIHQGFNCYVSKYCYALSNEGLQFRTNWDITNILLKILFYHYE